MTLDYNNDDNDNHGYGLMAITFKKKAPEEKHLPYLNGSIDKCSTRVSNKQQIQLTILGLLHVMTSARTPKCVSPIENRQSPRGVVYRLCLPSKA